MREALSLVGRGLLTPPACGADPVKQDRTGMKSGAGFAEWAQDEVATFKRRCEARLQAAIAVLGAALG